MEKNPELTNYEIKEIIERSGNLYPFGNNYVGYGIPDAKRVLKLTEDIDYNFNRSEKAIAKHNHYILPINSEQEERIVVFHKKIPLQ